MKRCLRAFAVAFAVLLSGCATGYLLDNTVQAFSGLPWLPASPSYRFERLPSQASPGQDQVEALADPALFKAGLRRDDAAPHFSVQVSARVLRAVSPWADPFDPWGWGWNAGLGFGGRRGGFGAGFGGPFPRMDQPWYHREVAVIVREVSSNKVVFESHAANDGPLLNDAPVLSAMFDAALQGFPNPPPGPRRVNIQVGGKSEAGAAQQPASAPAPGPAASAPAR